MVNEFFKNKNHIIYYFNETVKQLFCRVCKKKAFKHEQMTYSEKYMIECYNYKTRKHTICYKCILCKYLAGNADNFLYKINMHRICPRMVRIHL